MEKESKFDGGLLELIGYSIVAMLIMGCTFGIAAPWAVCLLQNWEAKHTVIEGRRLKFVGTGLGLFGHYIIWFALTIVTFGIYSFWLVIKMKQWIVANTQFDD